MVFSLGVNNSVAAVFGNAGFGEIKGHILRATAFLKDFLLWKFYVRAYFT